MTKLSTHDQVVQFFDKVQVNTVEDAYMVNAADHHFSKRASQQNSINKTEMANRQVRNIEESYRNTKRQKATVAAEFCFSAVGSAVVLGQAALGGPDLARPADAISGIFNAFARTTGSINGMQGTSRSGMQTLEQQKMQEYTRQRDEATQNARTQDSSREQNMQGLAALNSNRTSAIQNMAR